MNEFIARNGIIAQNNSTVSGSLTVTEGITGSLDGIAASASYLLPLNQYVEITGSLTQGANTQALGEFSHAEGDSSQAINFGSHAEGANTQALGEFSHSEGNYSQAIGNSSHAEGLSTATGGTNGYLAISVASGLVTLDSSYGDISSDYPAGNYLYLNDLDYDGSLTIVSYIIDSATFNGTETEILLVDISVATTTAVVGNLNLNAFNWAGDQTYRGDYSHAEGSQTFAIGVSAHAEGSLSVAVGASAHAEGLETQAIGDGSHAQGNATITEGNYSHAEGSSTQAIGYGAHAEGSSTQAAGESSHAEGASTTAAGLYSHAEGFSTQAVGEASHAEGDSTTAQGSYSHAEGSYTQAIGNYSHAEGANSQTIGDYSHAEGKNTRVIGQFAHAEGEGTIASGSFQHVSGQFNTHGDDTSLFIIGNGVDDATRSDVFRVSGSTVQVTGSLNVSQGITGSLEGTASYALNGGSIDTSSFATTGSNIFIGNQTISGTIDFGDGSVIQSISASSGDGGGYTTLTLKPNTSVVSDQYIVLDPTTPNHIHIRAGGLIDSSSAYLYLGGEKANVVVRNLDNSFNEKYWVQINSQTGSTQNTWIFDDNGDLTVPGNITGAGNLATTGSNQFNDSQSISGSLNVSQGITGSLEGTASYALTASYAMNGGGGGGSSFPYTGSAQITGSLGVTGSITATSFFGDGSNLTGVLLTNPAINLFNYYNNI